MCDRGRAETFADVRSNVPKGYKGFPVDDGNDMEIPMMYSQKLDMSPKDIMSTWSGRSSEGRTGSSGLKRKRGGQAVETVEINHNAMDYVNDQSKAIAEWLNVQRQDARATCAEVVRQLLGIPKLK